MKLKSLLILAALLLPFMASAADTPCKREMRSAWVATVWRLDWPPNTISKTGDEAQIKKQQDAMTRMLDSLAVNNFNAINFQVRSRCDAMYKSSFEPWSSDLVSERGLDPGWDPLQWVVEECHKRGMECHAWLNPYRYESQAGQWNGSPNAYRDTHPEWLIDVVGKDGTASILNPGLPQVTKRICDVIEEIVRNYDIDGVLFDDYFYLSGTSTSHDGNLYDAYKADGGTLSIGDWRRSNVNNMIAQVYKTIKGAKPWVRFGVSPAGIACTSPSVAKKYGISPCPTGSDWQYNDIYSDPIAWISQQNLDFISPQVYWTTQASTNYLKATKWWSEVADKWGRHLYVSHSISSLTGTSKMPGLSGMERSIKANPLASGGGADTFDEYVEEVRANREYTLNDAPGSIFYSAKYLYASAPKFAHHLRKHVFNTKALVPAVTWQKAPEQNLVENLQRNGSRLTWKAVDNVRYTVYAFPENMPLINFNRDAEYLLGTSYTPSFTIPESALGGKQYAVCILDRYGNEYSPAIAGVPTGKLDPSKPVFPAAGEAVEAPFDFQWTAVEGATEYIIELALDAELNKRIDQRSTGSTSISTLAFNGLPTGGTVYWRVRSCGPGNADGLSEVSSFAISNMAITYPAHQEQNLPVTLTVKASIADRDGTLVVATNEDFAESNIVLRLDGRGSFAVPVGALAAGSRYWARIDYSRAGTDLSTNPVCFTTEQMEAEVPKVILPIAGGKLYSDQYIAFAPISGASGLRVEVSTTEKFPVRTSFVSNSVDLMKMTLNKAAKEIKLGTKYMTDGTTYYLRARSIFSVLDEPSVESDYCPTVSFVYSSEESGVSSVIVADGTFKIDGSVITVTAAAGVDHITVLNASGAVAACFEGHSQQGDSYSLNLPKGVYIITAIDADGATVAAKAIINQ